ncbi:MAG: hypothetical protein ACRELA_04140 [Candidatus Rokuibacteriota bacterium]
MLHSSEVAKPAEGGSYEELVLRGLDADQIRFQRRSKLNSLAWLLGHMSLAEDMVVNAIVADSPQVVDRDGWPHRLGVARRDIGTGMSGERSES